MKISTISSSLFLVFIFTSLVYSQPSKKPINQNLNLPNGSEITDIEMDDDGSIYLSGTFTEDFSYQGNQIIHEGLNDAFILKTDNDGKYIWHYVRSNSTRNIEITDIIIYDNKVFATGAFDFVTSQPAPNGVFSVIKLLKNSGSFVESLDASTSLSTNNLSKGLGLTFGNNGNVYSVIHFDGAFNVNVGSTGIKGGDLSANGSDDFVSIRIDSSFTDDNLEFIQFGNQTEDERVDKLFFDSQSGAAFFAAYETNDSIFKFGTQTFNKSASKSSVIVLSGASYSDAQAIGTQQNISIGTVSTITDFEVVTGSILLAYNGSDIKRYSTTNLSLERTTSLENYLGFTAGIDAKLLSITESQESSYASLIISAKGRKDITGTTHGLYPFDSELERNIYKIDVVRNGNNVNATDIRDIDNLGEVKVDEPDFHLAANRNANKEYAYTSTVTADGINIDRETIEPLNTSTYLFARPNTYIEIISPEEDAVLKQFSTYEVSVYGYDRIPNVNMGDESDSDQIRTFASKFLGRNTERFGTASLNNTSGNLQGNYFIHTLPEFTNGEADTVNVFVEKTGNLKSPITSRVFSNILAKRDTTRSFIFENTGTANLTVSSASFKEGNTFSVRSNITTLTPGDKDTVFVSFTTTAGGTFKDTLKIVSDAANSELLLPFSATAQDINVDAQFAATANPTNEVGFTSPRSVFSTDSTQLGKIDTASTYIISNGTDNLILSSFEFKNGEEFSLSNKPEGIVTLGRKPEDSFENRFLKLDIAFNPSEFKLETDTLIIQSNDSTFNDGIIEIPLRRVGKDSLGRLEILQDLVLNDVPSENGNTGFEFNIRNSGLKDLTITEISFTNDFYEFGERIESNGSLRPYTNLELTKDESTVAAIQASPNFYDIKGDTVINDVMTIFHTGSGGKSTFDIVTKIVKTKPKLFIIKPETQIVNYNFNNGSPIYNLNNVFIQNARIQTIQLMNAGDDTLNIDRLSVKPVTNLELTEDDIRVFQNLPSNVVLAGDTVNIEVEFDIFKLEPFQIDVEVFTNSNILLNRVTDTEPFQEFILEEELGVTLKGVAKLPSRLNVTLNEFRTDTLRPSFVNILFQATDQFGRGLTYLDQPNPRVLDDGNPKTNFFTLTEEGREIKPNDAESEFQIVKRDAIDFEVATALVLDNSFSIRPTDLPIIKEAAIELINQKFDDQKIAIYTFSETVTLLQDFTKDKSTLINAINGINRDKPTTNLFGAVITAAEKVSQERDFNFNQTGDNKIVDGNILVFTDGEETQFSRTLNEAQEAVGDIPIYLVGVGNGVNADQLRDIGGNTGRVFEETDVNSLARAFRSIQREIEKIANSIYWLNYISPARNGSRVVEVTVDGNENTGTSGKIRSNFSADDFSSVDPQVVINQSFPDVFGIDTLIVPENSLEFEANASTILNFDPPGYKWVSSDENIVKTRLLNESGSRVSFNAMGSRGDETFVTITDTVNVDGSNVQLSKKLLVILGEPSAETIVNITIPAGATSSYPLDSQGSELKINQNNGDEFSLKITKSSNPGGSEPDGIDAIYNDFYFSIELNTNGTIDIDYELTFDVSDINFSNESLATILKREDGSSAWQNVKNLPNTILSVENGLITVTGLTSFSEFAIAEETDAGTVSNESLTSVPAKFSLEQNYPNPFNPSTTIRFGLPNASEVNIEIYNMIGQKVMVLSNNRFGAGWHTVSFNASGLSSGIYIYRIRAGSFVDTKRMTLIK
ncbi:MAG: VWA domain-containing protein [Balneola sp.]